MHIIFNWNFIYNLLSFYSTDNRQASPENLQQDDVQIMCVLNRYDCNDFFVLAYDFLSEEKPHISDLISDDDWILS